MYTPVTSVLLYKKRGLSGVKTIKACSRDVEPGKNVASD